MPRRFFPSFSAMLCAAAAGLLCACSSSHDTGQSGDPLQKISASFLNAPIKVTPLTHGVDFVTGPGGNILTVSDKKGTLLVDDGIARRVAMLAHDLKAASLPPVLTVVNTHYHFDHTGGNAYFASHGAAIIAQENVKKRLASAQKNAFFGVTFPASARQALPARTFKTTLTLREGAHVVQLVHYKEWAHTDGDTVVYLPEDNIIHTGDIFFNNMYPFIDYGVGGWIGGMVSVSDHIIAKANDDTVIVPGHGPLARKKDLIAYRDMLSTVQMRITSMIEAGKTEDEVVAARPTRDFDGKWGGGAFNATQFTRIVYRGIVAHNKS